LVDATGTTVFANQTDFTIDGGDSNHLVTLDNPNTAAGLESLFILDLGTGSEIEGVNTSGADVTVAALSLIFDGAPGDIGDHFGGLRTQVSNLVVSDSRNVTIINGVSAPTTLNLSLGASGFVNLTNNGTINATGSGVSGNDGVNLTTNGSTADLNTGSNAEISSSLGAVDLQAGEDINLGDGVGTGSVVAQSGTILSAGRNVTLNANAVIQNNSSGNITINAGIAGAGGDITMLTSPGSLSGAPEIINNASTGAINLTTGKGGALTVASTDATGVESANGAITLAADAMVLEAAINSGTATTTLEPVTAGQAITLGGANAPGVLGLTQAELNEISAGTLRIGDIAAGNIAITASISNPSGDQIVSLVNNGSISESSFGSLSIPNLRISSTGPVTLASANNVIATLAANTANGLTVNDGTHTLTIGGVDTVTGITTNNSAINLTADGMNLGDQVDAGTGVVTLSAFSAAQQISLGGSSGNLSGTLGLSDAELSEITAGVLRIDAITGNITSGGAISSHAGYSTLSLATAGAINLTSAISVANLALNAGVDIDLAGANTIGTVAFFDANNSVAIADSTSLIIGSVDGITSSSSLGSSTTIYATGNLTFDAGLYSAGAAALTSSAGAILDGGKGAILDVTAPSAALSASTGIGTSAGSLQTQLGALSATTSTGGIYINNDGAAPGTLNIGVGTTGVTNSGSGDISIINNGTINSLVSGANISGSGNITLKALGANADINIGSQADLFSVIDSGSKLLDIEAGRDLNLGNSAGFGAINGGTGSVKLVAGRNLTVDPNAYVETSGGAITATAGGNFTMATSPGSLNEEFFSEGGAIGLTAGAGATMTLTSNNSTAVSSSGGNISLTADFLNIGKTVNAGSGNVLIQPVTAGEQVSLGGAANGGLSLTNAELDDITAKTITIGDSSAGEVSLAGTISPTSGTNLTIDTGSGVSANGATINLGSGVLTIDFDEAGTGATANLSGAAFTASTINLIGGAAIDTSNFVNDGELNVLSGSIKFSGGFTNNGVIHGLVTQSGGVTTVSAATPSDFNGDGMSDILWQNTSGQAAVWEMNGDALTGGGPVSPNPGAAWKEIGSGDFTGDGRADILWQNTTTGQASIWEMNGNALIGGGAVTPNPGPSWKALGSGDFNGDGLSDILFQNTSSGQVSIWEMNGNKVIGGGVVGPSPGSGWTEIGTGDFNGDGRSDIVWQNTSSGQVSIWEMNGTNIVGGGVLSVNPGPSLKAIGTGDFYDDGHSDILFQNTSSGQASIWEMNGNTVIGGGPVSPNPGSSWRAVPS
jgi:hypothetical protein